MNKEQIKHMVDRFLGWKLPADHFNPDGGISFQKTHSEQGPFGPQKYEPSGTNLFDATQADAMVRYMIEGMPAGPKEECGWVIELGRSSPSAPEYWCGNGWSTDHMRAVRFARQSDAENTSKGWDDDPAPVKPYRIAEHIWG